MDPAIAPRPRPDVGRVAVVGLGLIGGSLARRLAPCGSVVGFDADPSTRQAASAAGLDVADSVAAAVTGSDLVFLAAPLPSYDQLLPLIVPAASPGTLLTDVSSVQGPALAAFRAALGTAPARYVGGHPMAGSERSGFAASDPRLFDGATWVLCLEQDTDLTGWLELATVLTGLACRVVATTAADHDAAAARVSGLPHLLAATLAATGAEFGPLALTLAAGSFRDGTRVADSPPELVASLCEGNRRALANALDAAIEELSTARNALAGDGRVTQLVTRGHSGRRQWARHGVGGSAVALDAAHPQLRASLWALGAAGGQVTSVAGGQITCWLPEPARCSPLAAQVPS